MLLAEVFWELYCYRQKGGQIHFGESVVFYLRFLNLIFSSR